MSSLYSPMALSDAPMAAIPTAYKGYEFRSKSEAIVARGFDLAGLSWVYEPERWQVDGWRPDFEVILAGQVFILEYKPDIPTDTYLRFLISRYRRYPVQPGLKPSILIGSPYNAKQRVLWTLFKSESFIPTAGAEFFTQHWQRAKRYRFDLKSA